MVRDGGPARAPAREADAGNSSGLPKAIARLAKVGQIYLLLGTGFFLPVMPQSTVFPPKTFGFCGVWNKSTNRMVLALWNGTTIARVSVQLIRYRQHRRQLRPIVEAASPERGQGHGYRKSQPEDLHRLGSGDADRDLRRSPA